MTACTQSPPYPPASPLGCDQTSQGVKNHAAAREAHAAHEDVAQALRDVMEFVNQEVETRFATESACVKEVLLQKITELEATEATKCSVLEDQLRRVTAQNNELEEKFAKSWKQIELLTSLVGPLEKAADQFQGQHSLASAGLLNPFARTWMPPFPGAQDSIDGSFGQLLHGCMGGTSLKGWDWNLGQAANGAGAAISQHDVLRQSETFVPLSPGLGLEMPVAVMSSKDTQGPGTSRAVPERVASLPPTSGATWACTEDSDCHQLLKSPVNHQRRAEEIVPQSPEPTRGRHFSLHEGVFGPATEEKSRKPPTPQPRHSTPKLDPARRAPWSLLGSPTPAKSPALSARRSLVPQSPQVPPSPFVIMEDGGSTFSFALRKADGVDLGLDLRPDKTLKLRVHSIDPDGAVEAWNKQCFGGPAAGKAIAVGDFIVGVNGIESVDGILRECSEKQLLRLHVLRRPEGSDGEDERDNEVLHPSAIQTAYRRSQSVNVAFATPPMRASMAPFSLPPGVMLLPLPPPGLGFEDDVNFSVDSFSAGLIGSDAETA